MNFRNPKLIIPVALATVTGWMFSSNLQKILETIFPNVSPLQWVLFAVGGFIFGIVKFSR